MTEEIINTDDYFYEITDESRGTIGYGCISYKVSELIRKIHKQNKQFKRLEQIIDADNKQIELDAECIANYVKEVTKLKQENERLKEENFNWEEINKLQEKYQAALEEIREIEELAYYSKGISEEPLSQCDFILDAINDYEQRRIKILTKINEVLK